MSGQRYTDEFGPNVQRILCQASMVVRGQIPARVRAELRRAVKAGALGHLPKDGLKPEVFFHPDHKHGAQDRQNIEAAYSIQSIAGVITSPAEFREGIEAMGSDVLDVLLDRAAIDKATGGTP